MVPGLSETELSLQKEQLQLKIIEIEDEAEKWQKEKDRIKSFTTNEKAILEQNFRDLVRDLEKQKEEVRAALELREQDAVDQVKVIVDALDERVKVLHEDKQTREQLHNISDSVLFLQEFGALMSNYSLPPPLPTYHVLLEGEGLGQSLGNFKDDLLNVCMRHIEKMCKADLSRNFIERNHMENGSDHRYMNNYTNSYSNEWNVPDTMKRYSMYLTPKAGGRTSYQPVSPSRLSKEINQKNFNNLYGTKGNYTSRVWEYSSTMQSSDDLPMSQGSSSFSLKGYPSLMRSQSPKVQPQTWKSGKQTLLSHYRPFYVNKGNGVGSNEAP
ncbi:tripartite motif-containing protein 29 isoform X2 [Pteronotus mesoamericanus]|uniref:tripartite motif-containing protein 29 isoform X2 n=1 Tax=Pteronotus mesoamericanus TaxID=1884717 RepID=UPI0023EC5962|nr:tripartite motif-containing protein 29 isoform X2 [Pteronotus parnellii mesoamericanus]